MAAHRLLHSAAVPALMFTLAVALVSACGGSPEAPPSDAPGLTPLKASGSTGPDKPGPTQPPITCPDFASTPIPFPTDLPPADTAEAGTIPGTFSVTGTGEATYTMPLVTPPGRAGIEPHLALTYSSGGGNGLLGMGFAVSGLSSITRCPSNLAQDGVVRDVRYDAADHFCLDGRRLVRIASTASTIEYRTFPDTFTRVVGHLSKAIGGQGALFGPTSFEVDTAAGLHVEYGTTPDSRVMTTGVVKRAWLASKATDKRGNYLTYAYWNDKADDGYTREYAPKWIRYTGHDGDPVLAPSRAVRFRYLRLSTTYHRRFPDCRPPRAV